MSDSDSRNDPQSAEDAIFDRKPDPSNAEFGSSGAAVPPGGLKAICLLAMVLSGFGLLTGCSGLASQIFASKMQDALTAMPGGKNAPGLEVQKEMNAKTLEITRRYAWVTVPLLVIKIAVEVMLLAGGIMAWGLKPRGRSWLLYGLIAAIVVESLQIVPGIMILRETFAVTSEFIPKMMAAQPGAQNQPAGMGNMMSTATSVMGVVSMVVAVGWLVAKIVFYTIGIQYLRKPAVDAFFEPLPN